MESAVFRRVFRLPFGVPVLASSLAYAALGPTAVLAAMPTCGGDTGNHFLGNGRSPSGVKGVYGEIEHLGQSLCTQSATKVGSWVLSWVSLDGPSTSGLDIYQVGYARCPQPVPAGPGSCPWNNGAAYFFAWYGRETGPCGQKYESGFLNLGSGPSGTYHFFQVSKIGNYYKIYIDEVFTGQQRIAWEIDDCWPGVSGVEWQNETLDRNDQGGGRVANPKGFHNNQYQDASGWHNANRALNSACDANSFPAHWHCVNSGSVARNFESWDDRVP
jgi:hypothetical protein